MKKLISKALLAVILTVGLVGLVGCSSDVKNWHIKKAEATCKEHGGIRHMDTVLGIWVECNDGKYEKVSDRPAN